MNDFIHGRRREGEARFEAGLNAGKFVHADFDNFVNGLLPRAYNPYLSAAFTADFLRQRLQIQQHIGIHTHILSHFVNHEQEAEILRFAADIRFDVFHQSCDGKVNGGFILKPAFRVVFAHIQHLHQRGNDEFAVERERLALFQPAFTPLLLEYAPELLCFAQLVNVLFQHGDFQIFPVKSEMGIKHFGEHAQYDGFILIDKPLYIDIKEDGFRFGSGGLLNQHECRGIIRELFAEALHCGRPLHRPVFQKVGEHFQEMRFTAAKEAGNPDSNISRRRCESVVVAVEKSDKVLFQLVGDHIFFYFQIDHICGILIDPDNAVNLTVNFFREHITNHQRLSPLSDLDHVFRLR